VAAYSNSWRGKARHIATNLNHLFSFVDTSCHLALASPLSCPHSFLTTPQTPIAGHTTSPLLRGGGPFPPPLEVHEWGAAVTQGALYAPPHFTHEQGPSLLHANPPCLCPAPCLCMNGVRARVTQGQGRRPFYAPPLCSPRRFRGRGKVCDPSLCPRPLLHADAPLFAQELPFVPCRVRTGFAPESLQGQGAPFTPLLCAAPAVCGGTGRYVTPPSA
jgi:hypothetical protein